MAFIFTRAIAVVSWLGVPWTRELAELVDNGIIHRPYMTYETYLAAEWEGGQGRHIAESLAQVWGAGGRGGGDGGGRKAEENALGDLPSVVAQIAPASKRLTHYSMALPRLAQNPYWGAPLGGSGGLPPAESVLHMRPRVVLRTHGPGTV